MGRGAQGGWRRAAGVRGAARTPSLARVGRDKAPPWTGAGPVAAGVPRGAEVLAGELRSGALVCFRCRQGAEQRQNRAFPGSASPCFHLTTSHAEPGLTRSLMRATSTEAHQGLQQLRVDTVVCVFASFTFRHVWAHLFCFVFLAYSL